MREFKLVSDIDKIKIRLINGDIVAMQRLVDIVKHQNFIREISFYKMKILNQSEFEVLSELLILRKVGVHKVSFKDCSLKESLVNSLGEKFENDEAFYDNLISDLTIQMRVNE